MPLIGELPAKGKSVKELEMAIAARLGSNYLRAPDVHVSVKDFTSQRYTIEGEVAGPGIYSLAGRTTLLQAIAQAKGLTRVADHNVAIFRDVNNTRVPTTYDISAIRSGEREDPILLAGDVIVVGEFRHPIRMDRVQRHIRRRIAGGGARSASRALSPISRTH